MRRRGLWKLLGSATEIFIYLFFMHMTRISEKAVRLSVTEMLLYWLYCSALTDQDKAPLSLLTTWEMLLSLLIIDEECTPMLEDVLTLFAFFHPVSTSKKVFSSDKTLLPC
jgi:hypothetical protein